MPARAKTVETLYRSSGYGSDLPERTASPGLAAVKPWSKLHSQGATCGGVSPWRQPAQHLAWHNWCLPDRHTVCFGTLAQGPPALTLASHATHPRRDSVDQPSVFNVHSPWQREQTAVLAATRAPGQGHQGCGRAQHVRPCAWWPRARQVRAVVAWQGTSRSRQEASQSPSCNCTRLFVYVRSCRSVFVQVHPPASLRSAPRGAC